MTIDIQGTAAEPPTLDVVELADVLESLGDVGGSPSYQLGQHRD